jgi:hypothetical protein
MSLRNEVINADVIEERDGIRALSTTELGWVSGGNSKKKDSGANSKDVSAMSEIFSEISEKFSVSGKVEISYKTEETAEGSKTEITVTFEVSTGGKDKG